MEKFSTWRDPSNGIAPFVLPVPTGDDASGPLLLVARLFQVIFAVIRFLLFIMMVGVFTLLDNILSLITVSMLLSAYKVTFEVLIFGTTSNHGLQYQIKLVEYWPLCSCDPASSFASASS